MSSDHPVFNRYTPGLHHVGSYQSSARPAVYSNIICPASGATTTSAKEIAFQNVTKFVTVRNDGDDDEDTNTDASIRLAFAPIGVHQSTGDYYNFIKIAASESFSADVKVTRLYLMSDSAHTPLVTVVAGLTNIPATYLSSSWTGSVGIEGG